MCAQRPYAFPRESLGQRHERVHKGPVCEARCHRFIADHGNDLGRGQAAPDTELLDCGKELGVREPRGDAVGHKRNDLRCSEAKRDAERLDGSEELGVREPRGDAAGHKGNDLRCSEAKRGHVHVEPINEHAGFKEGVDAIGLAQFACERRAAKHGLQRGDLTTVPGVELLQYLIGNACRLGVVGLARVRLGKPVAERVGDDRRKAAGDGGDDSCHCPDATTSGHFHHRSHAPVAFDAHRGRACADAEHATPVVFGEFTIRFFSIAFKPGLGVVKAAIVIHPEDDTVLEGDGGVPEAALGARLKRGDDRPRVTWDPERAEQARDNADLLFGSLWHLPDVLPATRAWRGFATL